jgi:hypothetical protein
MIPVTRTSTPDILKQKANTWLKELQEAIIDLEKIENSPKPIKKEIEAAKKKVDKAQNKYNPGIRNGINPVKQPLYDMFYGKCAFCERKVEISAGRIEHFRPKSQYVDLTFDWNNLLYACEVCNNAENKGNKFVDVTKRAGLINHAFGLSASIFDFNRLKSFFAMPNSILISSTIE